MLQEWHRLRNHFPNKLEALRKESIRHLTALRHSYYSDSGLDVMNADWDTLILLDACRYDFFRKTIDIDGELQKVISKGSNSPEFIEANFGSGKFHDTVYVTANPHFRDLEPDTFHAVKSTLNDKTEQSTIEITKRQHPDLVTDLAIDSHREFPNKRLIIHYMQPHKPYIGPTAEQIRERLVGTEFEREAYNGPDSKFAPISWKSVTNGPISVETYREAYKETLEIVLDSVKSLLPHLDGRTVISADHGELLFDRVFGIPVPSHRPWFNVPELREVPWFVVPHDNRRTISEDQPVGIDDYDEQNIKKHLKALGYK